MKRNILITMVILILVGFAVQGIFGAVAGIFVASIIGVVYGAMKRDKLLVKWSSITLVITILCVILFYVGLINSDM